MPCFTYEEIEAQRSDSLQCHSQYLVARMQIWAIGFQSPPLLTLGQTVFQSLSASLLREGWPARYCKDKEELPRGGGILQARNMDNQRPGGRNHSVLRELSSR